MYIYTLYLGLLKICVSNNQKFDLWLMHADIMLIYLLHSTRLFGYLIFVRFV